MKNDEKMRWRAKPLICFWSSRVVFPSSAWKNVVTTYVSYLPVFKKVEWLAPVGVISGHTQCSVVFGMKVRLRPVRLN